VIKKSRQLRIPWYLKKNQLEKSLIFCSTQFCVELPLESLLMTEKVTLNGPTLKNYLCKKHEKRLQKQFFLNLNRPKYLFFRSLRYYTGFNRG
jgi:hypothetical protein